MLLLPRLHVRVLQAKDLLVSPRRIRFLLVSDELMDVLPTDAVPVDTFLMDAVLASRLLIGR